MRIINQNQLSEHDFLLPDETFHFFVDSKRIMALLNLIPDNSVSTYLNNQNVAFLEQYKGNARSVFDLEIDSEQISCDFLVILTSSKDDGIKFDLTHKDELCRKIEEFKNKISTVPANECLQETWNIHAASVVLRRIVKSSNESRSSYMLEVEGQLQYVV